MKKEIWFKAKSYGWGWYPATWQGWLAMFIWIGFNLYIFLNMDSNSDFIGNTLINFALPFILSTLLFLLLCYKKGEYPKWRWGKE